MLSIQAPPISHISGNRTPLSSQHGELVLFQAGSHAESITALLLIVEPTVITWKRGLVGDYAPVGLTSPSLGVLDLFGRSFVPAIPANPPTYISTGSLLSAISDIFCSCDIGTVV
jgi:hypothetical protein